MSEVDKWLIFLNNELLFWTEQEEFANYNDVAEEEQIARYKKMWKVLLDRNWFG